MIRSVQRLDPVRTPLLERVMDSAFVSTSTCLQGSKSLRLSWDAELEPYYLLNLALASSIEDILSILEENVS